MKKIMVDTVVGLSIPDLIKIQHKLQIMRLDTKDLLEFLDRDKIQLFAEKIDEIKTLKSKLKKISEIASSPKSALRGYAECLDCIFTVKAGRRKKENMRTGTHKPKKVMTVGKLKEYLIEQKVPDETIITESMSFVDGMELWTATDDGNNQLYLMMREMEECF